MTIIAYKDGVMASDSVSDYGGILMPVVSPKIVKNKQGDLAGATGLAGDCQKFRDWFLGGEKESPSFIGEEDDLIMGIVVRLNGTVWICDGELFLHMTETPIAIGSASLFCMGSMLSGFSAEDAVRLSIKYFAGLGGDVQIERIGNT